MEKEGHPDRSSIVLSAKRIHKVQDQEKGIWPGDSLVLELRSRQMVKGKCKLVLCTQSWCNGETGSCRRRCSEHLL
jgi:hypothetical protein